MVCFGRGSDQRWWLSVSLLGVSAAILSYREAIVHPSAFHPSPRVPEKSNCPGTVPFPNNIVRCSVYVVFLEKCNKYACFYVIIIIFIKIIRNFFQHIESLDNLSNILNHWTIWCVNSLLKAMVMLSKILKSLDNLYIFQWLTMSKTGTTVELNPWRFVHALVV